jgi:acyl-CoA reductase-like NAD-dependent aldehyde dehydrogenase
VSYPPLFRESRQYIGEEQRTNHINRAVHINSMTVHDEWTLPHGGAKASGFGRFNGNWGIEEFLRTKTITYKE